MSELYFKIFRYLHRRFIWCCTMPSNSICVLWMIEGLSVLPAGGISCISWVLIPSSISENLKLSQAVGRLWHHHVRYPLHRSWMIGKPSFSNKRAGPLKTNVEPIGKPSKELATEKISNSIIGLEYEKKNFKCRWMPLKTRRTKLRDNRSSNVLPAAQTDGWHTIPW